MMLYSNNVVPLHVPITIVMPRQMRKKSGTGIYHVMHHGINRQDIFGDEEDYLQFLKIFHTMVEKHDGPKSAHRNRPHEQKIKMKMMFYGNNIVILQTYIAT